jgi:GTPase SAR1 family protein
LNRIQDTAAHHRSSYAQWSPEVAHFNKGAPVVLVGSKMDLRQSLSQTLTLEAAGLMPVSIAQVRLFSIPSYARPNVSQGKETATKIGAVAYMECSALTGYGIRSILEKAAWEAKKVHTKSRRRRVECIVG